jgi:hypothetical protein
MPTTPHEKVLNPELAQAQAQDLIELASPLLRELVNNATWVYLRCQAEAMGHPTNEDVAPLLLFLHIIEISDGVEVLLSKACAVPAVPLARSAFEAALSLEYILKSDTTYVQRSLTWLFYYIRKRQASYRLFDPSTEQGREFAAAALSDAAAQGITFASAEGVQPHIARLDRMLQSEQFRPILEEYRQVHDLRQRRHWYQLFHGPSNLRDLAVRLDQGAQYDVFYRDWSSITHAEDVSRFIAATGRGDPTARLLRGRVKYAEVGCAAARTMLSTTRLMLAKFRRGEETALAGWYKKEVQGSFQTLCRSS